MRPLLGRMRLKTDPAEVAAQPADTLSCWAHGRLVLSCIGPVCAHVSARSAGCAICAVCSCGACWLGAARAQQLLAWRVEVAVVLVYCCCACAAAVIQVVQGEQHGVKGVVCLKG